MGYTAVLGATGTMGRLLVPELQAAGHEVRPISRSAGVDVVSGDGLHQALVGVDTVVDCLNIDTLSAARGSAFFEAVAQRVLEAAPDLKHVVVLSIVNVDRPAVNRALGYYRAKHAHEEAWRRAFGERVTVVRSTQWFELGETLLGQIRVGPLAVVTALRTRPVAAAAVARRLAQSVEEGPGVGLVQLAGPQELGFVHLARAARRSDHPRVVGLPIPKRALREGLLPDPGVPQDSLTLAEWRRTRTRRLDA